MFRRTDSCAHIMMFALIASSIPPLIPNPATAFTGASSSHRRTFLPFSTARETSMCSTLASFPKRTDRAMTRGSFTSLSLSS